MDSHENLYVTNLSADRVFEFDSPFNSTVLAAIRGVHTRVVLGPHAEVEH